MFLCILFPLTLSSCVSYKDKRSNSDKDIEESNTNKSKITDLQDSSHICQWVIDKFNTKEGILKNSSEWRNVKSEILKYPKEYSGYIKYLLVDIDNNGEKEYLVKVTSRLGGTLSALNLIIVDENTLFNPPVLIENLLQNAIFSLNRNGSLKFSQESKRLREIGIDISDPRLTYGYSAYQLQNKFIDVFKFNDKHYLLLNNYLDPYNEKLALVASVNKSLEKIYYVSDLCFFKN